MKCDPFQNKQYLPHDVLQYFTNREEAIKQLGDYLAMPTGEALKALIFYGVGGIGKTTLQRKMCDELENNKPPVPFARFDMGTIKDQTHAYREVLLNMRFDFEQRGFKIKFSRFDICWAVITAYEEGNPEPLAKGDQVLMDLLKFAASILGAPVAGLEGLVGKKIRQSPEIEKKIRHVLGTEDVMDLRRRVLAGDATLVNELIKSFVLDLADGLPVRDGKICRAVIFIDNYETLWTGREGGSSAQARELDEWVRKLVSCCIFPSVGVLPVICGRDSLLWVESDSKWDDDLDQHRLDGLSINDAQLLLSRGDIMGTSPTDLQDAIISCCTEEKTINSSETIHPFYLLLCADIVLDYRENKGVDPSPDDFSDIYFNKVANKLADLFLKSLDRLSMELWVTELSLTQRFDEKAALALDDARYHYNGRAGWVRLIKFSFMQLQSDGFYQFHGIMRDVLADRLSKEDSTAVHEWFCDYWNERKELGLKSYHQWTLLDILNKNEIVSDKYFEQITKIYDNGSEEIKKLAITSINDKKEIDIDRTFTIIEGIIKRDEQSDVTYFAIYNLIDFFNYSPERVLKILNEIITNSKNTKHVYAILNRLHDSNFKQDGTISILRKIIHSDSTDINLNHKRIACNILMEWGSEIPEISKFDPSMFKKMNVKEIFEFIDNYISSDKRFVFINEHLLHLILCELYKINPYMSCKIMKKSLIIPALANFEPIAEVLANPIYYDAKIINNFLAEKNEWILRFTGFMALEFNINNEFKGATLEKHEETKNVSISIIENLLNDEDQFLKEIARATYERTTRIKENTNPKKIDKIKYKVEDKMLNHAINLAYKINNIIDLKMTKGYVEADFELTAQHQALFFWLLYNSTLPDSDPKDTSGLLSAIKRNGIIEKNIVQFVYQKVKNDPCDALQILEKFGIKSDDFMTRLGAIVGIDIIGRRCPQKALEILDSALPVMERELKFIYIGSGSTGLLRNYMNETDIIVKEKSRHILEKLRQDKDSELGALADMVLNGIQLKGS